MTSQPPAQRLKDAIAKIFALNTTTEFQGYWELYERTAKVSEIQELFVRIDADTGYCNVAIMGEGRIADIEGNFDGSSGSLHTFPLSSVNDIVFHYGPLPSFSRARGASLVMLVDLTGQGESGPYWAARTLDEKEQLIEFGRSLVQYISHS